MKAGSCVEEGDVGNKIMFDGIYAIVTLNLSL